ncbi:hypothetical protein NL676_002697 [Syzygium grande]|nr:hypothetical protein NL676_002697 [Syzygium grande]
MLDLTVELVAQAASNSLVVFCFCNLLIVIILMSPKPSSNLDERSELHLGVVTHDGVMDEQRLEIEQPPEDGETWPEVMELRVCENLEKEGRSYRGKGEDDNEGEQRIDIEQPPEDEETWPEVMQLCVCENLEKEGGSYNGKGEDDNEDDGESDNDDDDELRRRIEAFIDKVNREWKEEKLRTQSM